MATLSNDDRLPTPVHIPLCISDHMKQCWKEKADEQSCYSSFLHTLENLYLSEATSDITYVSRVKLRYLKYASGISRGLPWEPVYANKNS